MSDKLTYKLRSGKPNKSWFFLKGMLGTLVPDCFYRARLESILKKASLREDYDYCLERANYYNKVCAPFNLPKEDLREYGLSIFHYVGKLGGFKRNMFHTAYYLDQHDVTRFFDPNLRWSFLPGDVYFTPPLCNCSKEPPANGRQHEFRASQIGQTTSFPLCR